MIISCIEIRDNNLAKNIFFFVIHLLLLSVHAQNKTDTANIVSYEEQVMVRINFDTNTEDFIASYGNNAEIEQIRLAMNNRITTSFSLDYKIISAALSYAPDFLPGNNDNDLKGKSSYTDFKFRFFPGKIVQTFNYKNIKGFYVDNMTDFLPEWRKGIDPYLQFPDLRIQTFAGSTAFVFNDDFSIKSIYYQREWQKKSSGSFIPVLEYDLTYFTNKNEGIKDRERQFNLNLNLGYHYNWIIAEKINFAPYIFMGIGGKWSNYRADTSEGSPSPVEKNKYITGKFGIGIHLGYNSERFLFGGKLNLSSTYYREDSDSEIFNNTVFGLIYLGYRFPPPKFLKRNYDKIKNKVPML